MTGPRILTLDLETFPAKVLTFGLGQQVVGLHQVLEPDRMACFAAKWRGEARVHFYSEFHHGWPEMVRQAHRFLDEADVVVTYNGDGFDIPWIKRSIREHNKLEGATPLLNYSPFFSADLYKITKKEKWISRKLAHITEQLHLSGKMSGTNFQLWVDCMNGDPKAWNIMRRYNKQDVVTTEEAFEEYLPDFESLPAPELWLETKSERPLCPKLGCGSANVTRQGFKRTKTRRYPQYQCKDCGGWFRDTRSEGGAGTT